MRTRGGLGGREEGPNGTGRPRTTIVFVFACIATGSALPSVESGVQVTEEMAARAPRTADATRTAANTERARARDGGRAHARRETPPQSDHVVANG